MSGFVIPVVFGIKILHLESKRVYVGFQTVSQYSDFTWLLIYTQFLIDLSSECAENRFQLWYISNSIMLYLYVIKFTVYSDVHMKQIM